MVPALLLIACWHGGTFWRERWLPMMTTGLAVVLPILGLLDFLTLGSHFSLSGSIFVKT